VPQREGCWTPGEPHRRGGRDEAGFDIFHHYNRARCGRGEEPFPHEPTIDGIHIDDPRCVTALDPTARDGGEARLGQEPRVLDHQSLPELVANPDLVRQAGVRRPWRRRFTDLFPTHAEERDAGILWVGRREAPETARIAPDPTLDITVLDRRQELTRPEGVPFPKSTQRDYTAVCGRAALMREEREQVSGGWGSSEGHRHAPARTPPAHRMLLGVGDVLRPGRRQGHGPG
jgi:hypothetical protein